MKYDIFISYRRSDREFVANVVRRLEARGVGVWYDVEIEGGADWRETIVEALTNSDMLAIFFSEDCNNSRQLKKELAIADNFNKPVVPILIEDTQPRGAYLYELADRNWIQAFPDPMSKLDELVDHLATLAGKTPDGLAGPQPRAALKSAPAPGGAAVAEQVARAAHASMDADAVADAEPVAAAPPIEPSAPAEPALAPSLSKSAAPRASDAYVGKVSERNKKKKAPTNDILPFRWIDLIFLAPLLGLLIWSLVSTKTFYMEGDPAFEILGVVIMCLGAIGLYGALVFPFRYYLRRKPFWAALGMYAVSSVLLYCAFMGAFLAGTSSGVFPNDDPVEAALISGGVWVGYAVVAFIIYGVLSAQRALSKFKSNIKKI